MTTYYVRKTGSDGAAGTSAGAAWLTIQHALDSVIDGDTVYIGAGTYSQVLAAFAGGACSLIGDNDGSHTGDPGEVIISAWTSGFSSAPSATRVLDVKDCTALCVWKNLTIIGGGANSATRAGTGGLTVDNCTIWGHTDEDCIEINSVFPQSGVALNVTIKNCRLLAPQAVIAVAHGIDHAGDVDLNVVIQNNLIWSFRAVTGSTDGSIRLSVVDFGGGGKAAGVVIANNMFVSAGGNAVLNTTSWSTTTPVKIVNNVIMGGILRAAGASQFSSNYNAIYGFTGLSAAVYVNVTPGANDRYNQSFMPLFQIGQEAAIGGVLKTPFTPISGSPLLPWGTDAAVSITTDMIAVPKPSGGLSASKSAGPLERANTFVKETGTVRTGTSCISATGPAVQDFQLPVGAASMTVQVYVRWDATYAGTKPQMSVLNGGECGVGDAATTATGSSGAWELLTLSFTPTSVGIVTIRLQSNDTNGGGHMYADDFGVS